MAPVAAFDGVMNLLHPPTGLVSGLFSGRAGGRAGGLTGGRGGGEGYGIEYGIIALVGIVIVGIICIALCMERKKSSNTYDMNGSKADGANGTSATKTDTSDYSWRSHDNMPPSTLQRATAHTQ